MHLLHERELLLYDAHQLKSREQWRIDHVEVEHIVLVC